MTEQRPWSTFAYAGGMVILTMLMVGCGGNTETEPAVGATTERPSNTTGPLTHDNTGDTMQTDFTLPPRKGESPRVTNGIPHIQLDQTANDDMLAKLSAWAFSLDGVVEKPSRASLPGTRRNRHSRSVPTRTPSSSFATPTPSEQPTSPTPRNRTPE